MIHRRYYGWFDGTKYRLSRLPPDAPIRPSVSFDTRKEMDAWLERKRGILVWGQPLLCLSR